MKNAFNQIGVIILAAGASRRMQTDKLILNIAGQPMIMHVLKAARAAGLPTPLVVVRPHDDGLHELLAKHDARQIIAPDSALGMGHSLRAGVHAIPKSWRACFICLGDMPFIDPQLLVEMAALAQDNKIIIPCHAGRRGNPLLWGRDYFEALAACEGDQGGRVLLPSLEDHIIEHPWQDGTIFEDIDTPAQFSGLGAAVI